MPVKSAGIQKVCYIVHEYHQPLRDHTRFNVLIPMELAAADELDLAMVPQRDG